MALEVRDHPERSRYELLADGRVVGFTEYHPDQRSDRRGVLVFPHTVVTQPRRGAGYGTILVQGALDDVRHKGMTIDPQCPFVADFIDEHPEYADLIAPLSA